MYICTNTHINGLLARPCILQGEQFPVEKNTIDGAVGKRRPADAVWAGTKARLETFVVSRWLKLHPIHISCAFSFFPFIIK